MNNSNKKRWFKKWWGILLIILCPYLLFLVILQSNLDKKKKIIFLALFGSFILFIFLITALEPSTEEKIAKDNGAKQIDKVTFGYIDGQPIWEVKSETTYYNVDFETGTILRKEGL